MDYFSVLGLTRSASQEEIKSAFRKLAMENHPDRVGHLDEAGQTAAARRMAEVNEAYKTLSNPEERRLYEQDLDQPVAAVQAQAAAAASTTAQAPPPPAPKRAAAPARPAGNMARDFSQDLRKNLATAAGMKFEPQPTEGFDWGLATRTWTAQYLIASRAFANADAAAAKKFLGYAEGAIASRGLRKQHTLLLMPFEKIFESAKVAEMCKEFCNRQGGTVLIVLLDMVRSEKLILGPKPKDAHLLELATGLKLPK